MTSVRLARGNDFVQIEKNLLVKRSTGRPNSDLVNTPNRLPKYVDFPKAASDVFEIEGTILVDSLEDAEEVATRLTEDIIGEPLGRDTLTLSFESGLYNLGEFDVFPVGGGSSVRVVWTAGEPGRLDITGLKLRVVRTD